MIRKRFGELQRRTGLRVVYPTTNKRQLKNWELCNQLYAPIALRLSLGIQWLCVLLEGIFWNRYIRELSSSLVVLLGLWF